MTKAIKRKKSIHPSKPKKHPKTLRKNNPNLTPQKIRKKKKGKLLNFDAFLSIIFPNNTMTQFNESKYIYNIESKR